MKIILGSNIFYLSKRLGSVRMKVKERAGWDLANIWFGNS